MGGLWGRSHAIAFTAMAMAGVCSAPAIAASLQWDANGVTPGTGGSGTWNTASPLWFNGTTFQTWSNAALDDAVFAGTAGTVTLGGAITAHNLDFTTTGYTLVGGSLTLGGVVPTVDVGSALTATIASPF
jgi:fibronectin-binding autotransporter adhesin